MEANSLARRLAFNLFALGPLRQVAPAVNAEWGHGKGDGNRKYWNPSPAEIARGTALIRETWPGDIRRYRRMNVAV